MKHEITLADTKSALALAQLLQFRKNIIGNWIADWSTPYQTKYYICRVLDEIKVGKGYATYFALSFETREQCNIFIQQHGTLLKTYYKATLLK